MLKSTILAILVGIQYSRAAILCYEDVTCANPVIVGPGCLEDGGKKLQCRLCSDSGELPGYDCDGKKLTKCGGFAQCVPPTPMPTTSPTVPNYDRKTTFHIENKCDYPIWLGFHLQKRENGEFINVLNDGGSYLAQNNKETITVPVVEGRIWGRTNCGWDETKKEFICDTGGCAAAAITDGREGRCCEYDNNGIYKCGSNLTPTSLVEFTLRIKDEHDNDFYDVSLVDGYSVPVSMKPMIGTYNKENMENYETLGEYACGDARINPFDAKLQCPKVMRVDGTKTRNITTSNGFDFSTLAYCTSICHAMLDSDDPMLEEWRKEEDASNVLEEFYNDKHILAENRGKRLSDLLCARCGEGDTKGTGCYDISNQCNYGCSPYIDGVPKKWPGTKEEYMSRACPNNGFTDYDTKTIDATLPLWPLVENPSGTEVNPAAIYKKSSPDAYSWQYNDDSSTFQCKSPNIEYEVTFCG